MDYNKTIEQWRLKLEGYEEKPAPDFWSCGCKMAWLKEGETNGFCMGCMVHGYDSDPSAWTPELYKTIEDAGLQVSFVNKIFFKAIGSTLTTCTNPDILMELIKSTPAQKASALARAIEGVGGG